MLGRERTIWRALPWPRLRHRLFRDDIDGVIVALLVPLRQVYFIQIGSHDGRPGDPLWTFRVVVPRAGPSVSRAPVDALDCTVWSGRSRRTVATWRAGDLVEVGGAVRRRFFRAGGGSVSRVEIEVASARVIRRRASA